MSLRFEMNLDLDALDHRVEAATPEALAMGMEHIREVAAPLTPIESGRLVGSAEVSVEEDRAALTWAGPYAHIQHERLDFRHEHGQAKFGETALLTGGPKAVEIVGEQIKRAM